jgi:GH3 auxin-responsive promoter
VHGGVNFEPYKSKLLDSLGGSVDLIETFPASEGFFAFQDTLTEPGLLLNTNSGMFFEFIPVAEIGQENPTRLSLGEVRTGEQYALLLTTNAGLWSYLIGDTVRFVSANPYRLVVTGRISHYISAFGEHVIGEEVDYAILRAAEAFGARIVEFSVAPAIDVQGELPYHEWFVEFGETPSDLAAFAQSVDEHLRLKNIYYDDLIRGKILQPLKIRPMQRNTFIEYMKSVGRLGGQNKVPRLGNDRRIADALEAWRLTQD